MAQWIARRYGIPKVVGSNPTGSRDWPEWCRGLHRSLKKIWCQFDSGLRHCGCRITVITRHCQCLKEGSTPFTRSTEKAKLGPILFQFPPSFKASPSSINRLETFLKTSQQKTTFHQAVELRDRGGVKKMDTKNLLAQLLTF